MNITRQPFPLLPDMENVPLWHSTKCLHRIRPRPDPFSPSVPRHEFCFLSILNRSLRVVSDIPLPLSCTVTSTQSDFLTVLITIWPPRGVNFIALLIRFLRIVFSRAQYHHLRCMSALSPFASPVLSTTPHSCGLFQIYSHA